MTALTLTVCLGLPHWLTGLSAKILCGMKTIEESCPTKRYVAEN
jgi:hypothetical protein